MRPRGRLVDRQASRGRTAQQTHVGSDRRIHPSCAPGTWPLHDSGRASDDGVRPCGFVSQSMIVRGPLSKAGRLRSVLLSPPIRTHESVGIRKAGAFSSLLGRRPLKWLSDQSVSSAALSPTVKGSGRRRSASNRSRHRYRQAEGAHFRIELGWGFEVAEMPDAWEDHELRARNRIMDLVRDIHR